MHDRLFESALGIAPPWFVAGVRFDEASKVLTVGIDFKSGTRFAAEGVDGEHPVHDTLTKTYRHLNFFQHECVLEVRTPRVKLPDGTVHLVKPPFAGRLSGFTLLFEALVLMLAPQMPFAAVARIVGISAYRVQAISRRYVALALEQACFGNVRALAIDETSRARGHDYITLAADADERRVLAVTEGRDANAIAAIADELVDHGCPPEQIESVSIDMSPAFIKGCTEQLPNARITFDKFHVVWHANAAVDKMRRIEQRSDKSLKGMRWSLLKDRASLRPEAAADLDALIARMTTVRTARAWVYKEQLREILERKQIKRRARHAQALVHLRHALQGRAHEGGRRHGAPPPPGHRRLGADPARPTDSSKRSTACSKPPSAEPAASPASTPSGTVIFLIAGKLDFAAVNPHAR
jgi:transposase